MNAMAVELASGFCVSGGNGAELRNRGAVRSAFTASSAQRAGSVSQVLLFHTSISRKFRSSLIPPEGAGGWSIPLLGLGALED
ncbi:MAG: hypothetical protein ACOX5R_08915 [bacterium]